ncbi:MAG: ABA4-like family protein [Microcoleaceae cyanobacterium]
MLSSELIFNIANLFVLPFWFLMIVLPNWQITRKVISSYIPFILLALMYVGLFFSIEITPETAAALANPKLTDITQLFSDNRAVAAGWVHFLVMDLFVGRWIYQEGQEKNLITTHSLLLCLFAGPFGLLSHIVTAFIQNLLRTKATTTNQPESLS